MKSKKVIEGRKWPSYLLDSSEVKLSRLTQKKNTNAFSIQITNLLLENNNNIVGVPYIG